MSIEPGQPSPAPGPPGPQDPDDLAAVSTAPLKTPLFQAVNAARYQRQSLIRKIQGITGRRLLCYVAGIAASVNRDDTLGFADLLHNVPANRAVDLVLHTPGGDIDAAEKLMNMVRTRVGAEELRAIVPDFAKSAGSLMVLAADKVLMSDSSELGPIDPQVVLVDTSGNRRVHSVQDYLDAYAELRKEIAANPNDVAAKLMLAKIEPAMVKRFEAALERAGKIAERHLKHGMFRNGGNYTAVPRDLLDTKRWRSHAQMISCQDAKDLGLIVEYVTPDDDLWRELWQLYCLQRLAVGDRQKLFESDVVSIPMDGSG